MAVALAVPVNETLTPLVVVLDPSSSGASKHYVLPFPVRLEFACGYVFLLDDPSPALPFLDELLEVIGVVL